MIDDGRTFDVHILIRQKAPAVYTFAVKRLRTTLASAVAVVTCERLCSRGRSLLSSIALLGNVYGRSRCNRAVPCSYDRVRDRAYCSIASREDCDGLKTLARSLVRCTTSYLQPPPAFVRTSCACFLFAQIYRQLVSSI